MAKSDLRVDWATHEAAKYACENWHYSRSMPLPPVVKIGAWECEKFIGVALFSRGASPGLGRRYNLDQNELCELSRIALTAHSIEVSRFVKIAVAFLKKNSPALRMIVSFADPGNSHHGGIYQAGNWIYTGTSTPELKFFHQGRWKHRREVVSKVSFGKQKKQIDYKSILQMMTPGKHRYLMPLDDEMRARVLPLSKPYPKRPKKPDDTDQVNRGRGSTDPDAPSSMAGGE